MISEKDRARLLANAPKLWGKLRAMADEAEDEEPQCPHWNPFAGCPLTCTCGHVCDDHVPVNKSGGHADVDLAFDVEECAKGCACTRFVLNRAAG